VFIIDAKVTAKQYYKSVREEAAQHGISLRSLAKAADMNPSQLSRAMNNNIDPLLSTMVRIERALHRLSR
jgi:transcriptional regulator with XRE-family HTH domain